MLRAYLLFISAIFLASAMVVSAAPSKEAIRKEKRLEDVNRKIRDEKKAVKAVTVREGSILDALDGLNKGLAVKREAFEAANKAKDGLEEKMRKTVAAIGRLEGEKKGLAVRFRQRLVAMYKMKKGTALAAVFSADTATSLGRRHKYLTMIMDSDSVLIEDYETNLLNLRTERMRIASLTVDIDRARSDALLKKTEAEALKREKTALLRGVKNEKKRRLKVLNELEAAAVELTVLISKLRVDDTVVGDSGGFAAMKGRLEMPVAGRVISSYGKVRNQKYNTELFNNGIIIESQLGTPVKCVYAGKVAYVGWLRGYGQVMIIDHGSGFYTLFAQLSKVLKEEGSNVFAGDSLALVGDTGPTGGPGLYLEIRQKGVPRDPEAWFVASAK